LGLPNVRARPVDRPVARRDRRLAAAEVMGQAAAAVETPCSARRRRALAAAGMVGAALGVYLAAWQ